MKKSMVAFGVLVLAAGSAAAQSSLVLYGVADIGLKLERAGAGTLVALDSGNQSGSRFGLRGSEDLGGGYRAGFVLESGFSIDTGAQSANGVLFNRQSYVSLAGGFGELKLGRIQTMVYSSAGVFDPFGDTLAGDSARLFNYGGSRTDNTVNYSFAAQNGLNGQLAWSAGEVAGDHKAGRTVAGALGYASGPIAIVLTHQSTINAAGSDTARTTLLGGNYDFGIVQPFVAYAVNRGAAGLDTRDGLVGVKIKIGPADTLMASVIHKWDRAIDHADATQIAIGFTHDLSRRTNLYTSWSRLTNGDNAAYKVSAKGKTNSLFNLGVRHRF